ncbi:dihydroxyacetone kinase family protein [Rhizobium lusitanum]|uniref:Dihydroxyacetone kinase n=1 Tax=Rhizobium lusitanum TaxID=293958 RepID=A0A7X0MCW1_9HYPH|nr:dihydroxyacetone kinase family protein [Rhizobium lusitanum]MBB6485796.1 dihydroxyacetone kinase [Rhizobium lusitanum]
MTKIFDAPEEFAATALAGFAALHPHFVRLIKGGVVRSTSVPKGKVSVVVGGGSGHYPAFAGYVGPGFVDAAVAGDVFASPSTAAVARVCRKAHHGGGILLSFGNYAGDVLNFGVAAERLRAEGIDVRIVAVTDDVASAPAETVSKRRGVAGDLVVFKIAGAAAEAGLPLDEVERIARHANARTVSFGVAFDGCTLPGSAGPLFTVPNGKMALGLGIHGEPGISEEAIVSASELATLLTEKLLPERPKDTRKVGVILNGLGATKYEELFVLWSSIAGRLQQAGLEIVAPEAGEFVTSLDMQGCSLTLVFLDDELEQHWIAPCSSPVLRRGATIPTTPAIDNLADEDMLTTYPPADGGGQRGGACIIRIFSETSLVLHEAEEQLGRIDAYAGDGDHGQGMARGVTAALEAAKAASAAKAGTASVLAAAADAWADRAGGTSGAIWGLLLRSWSTALSDNGPIDDRAVVAGARQALDGVVRLGGAKIGDKTLVDVFSPFVDTLEKSFAESGSLSTAWRQAASAAKLAAEATAQLLPKLGRARPLAEKSLGHPDPGAVSFAMIATRVATLLR